MSLWSAGATTSFLYDGPNFIQELSGSTPAANLLTAGIDQEFARASTGAENFLTDSLSNKIATTDTTGAIATQYTYEPFGNTTSTGSATTNSLQYTGRENDGTGLYYYRARYYNSKFGRFISQDPIGLGGGGTNLYSYAANDPINFNDPHGLYLSADHRSMTTTAALNKGWDPQDAADLAQQVVDVDFLPGSDNTDAAHTNMHSMSGRKDDGKGPYQTCDQARTATADLFMKDLTFGHIPADLHIIQDAWSPLHQFQEWPGLIDVIHPAVEFFAPGFDPQDFNTAESMSELFLQDLKDGVPINPLDYFPTCHDNNW